MIVGHWAPAFVLAAYGSPTLSLPLLFALAQAPDILQIVMTYALGWERVSLTDTPPNAIFKHILAEELPWSHSLFSSVVMVCAAHALVGRAGAVAVASHWALDALVHYPPFMDPCWPFVDGCPRVSLGLWRSAPISLTLESMLISAGALVFVGAQLRRAKGGGRAGMAWGVVAMVVTGLFVVASVLFTFSLPDQPKPHALDWTMGATLAAFNVVTCGYAAGIDLAWGRFKAARKVKDVRAHAD